MSLLHSVIYGLLIALVLIQWVWFRQSACELKGLRWLKEKEDKDHQLEISELKFKASGLRVKVAKIAGELAKLAQEETKT